GADGQVVDHHVGPGVAQDPGDVGGRAARLADPRPDVLADAVVGHAAADGHAETRHFGEGDGVVRLGEDRLAQVAPDFGVGDVEGGRELDVADVVAAEV